MQAPLRRNFGQTFGPLFKFKRLRRLQRKLVRPLILILLGLAIVTEVVILSPSQLEQEGSGPNPVDLNTLVMDDLPSLVPGFPRNQIADYSIDQFKYVCIQNGEKQWRIESSQAFMFSDERLMHARTVHSNIYDPEGQITTIAGDEARYFLNHKDLEVYGNVKTVFPDGFELYSEYLRYLPKEKKILIPTQYHVSGTGHETEDQDFRFESQGLDYAMGSSIIILPKAAVVTILRTGPPAPETSGIPQKTVIESDHCYIDRSKNFAHFTMDPHTPLKERFVHITQPTLFARSRSADLNYGNFNKVLQYLVAYDDVLVKETRQKTIPGEKYSLRYATSGHAEFDTRRDVIIMTQFPQAYENSDTVTGEVLLMHRDSDIIEVSHSNAFSQGSE
jgi:LPS export ABC transporter protein LptC